MAGRATWTAGKPTISVDASGTLTASVPVLDAGTLVATLTFTLTTTRGLEVLCTNQPGAAGFTDFQAWMKEG